MRKYLFVAALGMICLGIAVQSSAQDSGIPDTFYVEFHPDDQILFGDPPYFVRFPVFITHDIVDPAVDSLAGIIAVLCYQHTNSSSFCSITSYWNNTSLYPAIDINRSIFRHFVGGSDTLHHNWMMDHAQKGDGSAWDYREVTMDGTSTIWTALFPTGSKDQRMGDGSRILLATFTFKLEDTTTICIDTCFWPPAQSPLSFSNSEAETYCPRHFFPVCESVCRSERGDANGDGAITITDVLYMLNYLFKKGPPPVSFIAGDANSDDDLGILDPLFLLNYLYKGGRPPGC